MARRQSWQTPIVSSPRRLGASGSHPPCPRGASRRITDTHRHPTLRQRLDPEAGTAVGTAGVSDPRCGAQRRRTRRSDRPLSVSGDPVARRRAHRSAGPYIRRAGVARRCAGNRVRDDGLSGCRPRPPVGRMRRTSGGSDRLRPVDHHRRRAGDPRRQRTIRRRASQVGGRAQNGGRAISSHGPPHRPPRTARAERGGREGLRVRYV